ncbi:hypothetical protein Tco_1014601 [Tanacetum coccineum]
MYLNLWSYKAVRHRFYTSAGNPVKEILLKLNLPDHRILKDGGEVKEFQERCLIQAFKTKKQQQYEHVGPKVTSSQDGKVYKMAKRDYAWLMISSDLGSLAVRTAIVENMAPGLHIVVGKKALGFEINGRDITKNDRDIETFGQDIEKNDRGIETFSHGVEMYWRMMVLRVMESSN